MLEAGVSKIVVRCKTYNGFLKCPLRSLLSENIKKFNFGCTGAKKTNLCKLYNYNGFLFLLLIDYKVYKNVPYDVLIQNNLYVVIVVVVVFLQRYDFLIFFEFYNSNIYFKLNINKIC